MFKINKKMFKITFIIFVLINNININQAFYLERTKTDIQGLYEALKTEVEDKTSPLEGTEPESPSTDFCQSLVVCVQGGKLSDKII